MSLTPDARTTVGVVMFDDVEELDFCGPLEVFSNARSSGKTSDETRLFRVVTIAERESLIRGRGSLLIQPHHTVHHHPPLDILVVPGGPGTRRERLNSHLIDWITTQDKQIMLTTSVCTGALLLAEAGILNYLDATTHWGSIDWMHNQYPAMRVVTEKRVVDTGHVVTSAGGSAGIDMALHVVGRLHGRDAAVWTARQMEYEGIGTTGSVT